jgi:spore maturation protein CgeD
MVKPKATVLTWSHNKFDFVTKAIESVRDQVFEDFEHIVVENSTDAKTRELVKSLRHPKMRYFERNYTDKDRETFYISAHLCNEFYPKARGEYMMFLADDDYLMPKFLEIMINTMSGNNWDVAFCSQISAKIKAGGEEVKTGSRQASHDRGKGTSFKLDCSIDGGTVLHRKSCLEKIEQPYYPEDVKVDIASHCDGLFMDKLGEHFTFHAINQELFVKRATEQSLWHRAGRDV